MLSKFIRNNFVIIFASFVGGFGNWLYSFLILKLVSVNELTIYYAIVGILGICSIPSSWIALMATSVGHSLALQIREQIKKRVVLFVALLAVSTVLIGVIAFYAKLSIELYFLVLFLTNLTNFTAYYRGAQQHELKFTAISLITISEVVIKILCFFFLLFIGEKSIAALLSLSLQVVYSFLINVWIVRKGKDKAVYTKHNYSLRETGILTLLYSASFLIFTNTDVLMARVYLSKADNASYIALLQLTKLLLFSSIALTGVLFTSIKHETDIKKLFKMSGLSSFLIFLGALVLLVVSYFKFDLLSKVFNIPPIYSTLTLVFLSYCFLYSLSLVALTILLVLRSLHLKYIVVFAATIQVLLYVLVGRSTTAFVNIYGVAAGVLLILSIGEVLLIIKGNLKFQSPNPK